MKIITVKIYAGLPEEIFNMLAESLPDLTIELSESNGRKIEIRMIEILESNELIKAHTEVFLMKQRLLQTAELICSILQKPSNLRLDMPDITTYVHIAQDIQPILRGGVKLSFN